MSQDSLRLSQDIIRPKTPAARISTPKPVDVESKQRTSSDLQTRRAGPLEDVLATPFAPFLQEQVLVTPYHTELNKDAEFQDQLNSMLLNFVLKFHSWSTSRPAVESASAGSRLSEDAQNITNIEKEQGMSSFFEESRQRLLEFITRIKDALAVLTGLN